MGSQKVKRITAFLLACIMVFFLGACGQEETPQDNGGNGENSATGATGDSAGNGSSTGTAPAAGGKTDDNQSVSPPVYDLPCGWEPNTAAYTSVSFVGDRLYYVCSANLEEDGHSEWRYVDAAAPQMESVVLFDLTQYETRGEELETSVAGSYACADGGTVLLLQTQPVLSGDAQEGAYVRRQRETTYQLKKLAADGTEGFTIDITVYLQAGGGGMAGMLDLQLFTDKEDMIYVSDTTSCVQVFNKEGHYEADIRLPDAQGLVTSVHILPDGRLGAMYQGGYIQGNGMGIAVYNPDTGQLSETHANLPPGCQEFYPQAGTNGRILLNGGGILYEYNMETKEYKELVKWADCGINAEYVKQAAVLTDGRLAVYCADYAAGTNSLILLSGQQEPKAGKEVLTLGALYVSPYLRAAVVAFNKTNAAYKIEIKSYGSTGNGSHEDATMLFYSDIMTGNAPDMFLAGDIDMSLFALKGLIADLTPYLEESAAVEQEDLFDTILSAYTVNDTLCAIPVSFLVSTLAGRTSQVGEESGWTLEEMIAFAEAHPETPILAGATKRSVLDVCLLYDFDSWVDWEKGECFFDTPEFKAVMEFANRYPAADESPLTAAGQIMAHQALLHKFHLRLVQDYQFETALFQEPITAIGFPSSRSTGVLVVGYDAVCISQTSPNKEAAWSFIETMLAKEEMESKDLPYGIPVRISAFEKELAEKMEPIYRYDGNGEVLLDENGKPKEKSQYGVCFDDMMIELYAVTQEEADGIRQIISRIDGIYDENNILMQIILEEVDSYFAGQKSVDEAADIIQNRVQLYLNESK